MTIPLVLLALAASPVQLEPPALTFGPRPEAAIVLSVPGAKSVVAISANGVGSVSAAERIAEGKFRARFTFPKERFPQLALIRLELEAEGGARSRQWLALPLIANADLKIETKPRATVTVKIGEKTFGPAIADARGKLTIAAQVPPGFATATVLAVDRAGNQTTKPLDLLVRPFPRVAAVLEGGEASPGQPAQLELFAVEADGQPLAKPELLKVSAKRGACDPPGPRGEGVFVATYRAPASVSEGSDTIAVRIEGTPLVTEVEVQLRAGAAARLVIGFTPPAYTAGSGVTPKVKVEAVDAYGNVVPIDRPVVTTDLGQVEAAGSERVLRIPDDFGGRTQALVRATAKSVSGEAPLPLIAARPARAELSLPTRIAAGESTVGQLVVADGFGNPVEKAKVEVVLPPGGPAAITELGGGRYEVALTPAPGDPPGERELLLTANGDAIGQARVGVMPYQRRWAVTVGALGFVQTNFAQWVTGGPRLCLGLRMGGSGLDVIAEGAFGAYAPVRGALAAEGTATFDVELQAISAAVGARYWFPIGLRTSLHLSAVAGVQSTSSAVAPSFAPSSKLPGTSWGPMLRGGGGIGLWFGIGRLVLQLEYGFAPVGGVIRGNVAGAGAGLGYLASF